MKQVLMAILTLLVGITASAQALDRNLTSANQEQLLARISKNLSGIQAIELLSIHPANTFGAQEDKLVIRSNGPNGSQDVEATRFRMMIDELLRPLYNADEEAIVTKTRKDVCYMTKKPTPELAVMRFSEKTNRVALDTILTNQSCAHSEWLAPESDVAETSARLLYLFLLGSS